MYHIPLISFLFTTFLFVSTQATAQVIITGSIKSDSKPVPHASIKWKKDSAVPVTAFSLSDKSGIYKLQINNCSIGWIEVSAVGYITLQQFVSLKAGDSIIIDLVVWERTESLATVIVKNEPAIQISGDTTSYSVSKFKRGNESSIKELLQNMPGFTVSNTGILIYNGKPIDRVLINGDDISGRNYKSIIEHLDVTGIEKMQVIQNYSDNTNIYSKILGGSEQVLNIAYNKGFLNRVFGNLNAAKGNKTDVYSAGIQAIGLFEDLKVIGVQQTNTMGKINLPFINAFSAGTLLTDGIADIELDPIRPAAAINNISTGLPNINAIHQNNTSTTVLNYMLKVSERFSIRGNGNILTDNYLQSLNTTTEYFGTTGNLLIRQGNEIGTSQKTFNGLITFNYQLRNKNQLIFTLKNNNSSDNSSSETLTAPNQQFEEEANNKRKQYGAKLIYSHLLPAQTALSAMLQIQTGSLPNQYWLTPPPFTDFFNTQSFKDIHQYYNQKYTSYSPQVKVMKKFINHTLTSQLKVFYKTHAYVNTIEKTKSVSNIILA